MTFYSASPLALESVSAVTSDPSVEVGTLRQEGQSLYAYVYNAGAAAIKVGWGCYINSSNSGYSVSVSNAASQTGRLFGVCHNASIPAGSYGWVVVRGVSTVAADGTETSAAAGVEIANGVDGGFVASPATFSTGHRVGFLISTMQTQGTTTPGKAWIKGQYF